MSEVVERLRQVLPPEALVTDPDRIQSYRYDRAMFCPAGEPLAVVLARETAHVQAAVRIAAEAGVPVVPQGARSGLSGAANALDGCIVVSLEKMDRILAIEPVDRYVVTQPGVFNAVLSRAVAEQGLFYPPDPSSWEFCSIGGNLSTNSGGLCCVKYGVTTDYVLGLEVVLADGRVLRTGRKTVKGVAGYDLTKLIVGSEGTLGIITEATLALRPAAARPRTMAALFDSGVAAGEAIVEIIRSGVSLSLLEIMDRTTIKAVNDFKRMDLPTEAAAMLIAQSDAGGEAGAADVAMVAKLCRQYGAIECIEADDPAEGELLLEARRAALVALEHLGTTMIDDVCVPRSRLADFIGAVEGIATEVDITVGVLGHAGDGNMHPTVVFDATDPEQARRAQVAFDRIMEVGLELGGTITGEHGVGVLKRDWLAQEIGPVAVDVHRAIKAALDPQNILNPGKVVAVGSL
ncbi:glycolate oxidase [Kribbella voronezhensis]|uniref:Glycolate oxidase n=1 Tax=Kribbella voronezhensis TaxID=2512212 RepID=A0A4R7T8J3_9ACTN|nr:FAD-linked oxidase C-terminal domain-containing protein [Kribbella voronezhensis]TDU88234.1 glycolate oxidase [Kribbella voronezhensis]